MLDEHAADLAVAEHEVVGPLQADRDRRRDAFDRLGGRNARGKRDPRPLHRGDRRDRHAIQPRVGPGAAIATTAAGLSPGHHHIACRATTRQVLRGSGLAHDHGAVQQAEPTTCCIESVRPGFDRCRRGTGGLGVRRAVRRIDHASASRPTSSDRTLCVSAPT
ncbi:MAG: hypothetical protein RLZZ217_1743, partial [Planctomycetota bacterium]